MERLDLPISGGVRIFLKLHELVFQFAINWGHYVNSNSMWLLKLKCTQVTQPPPERAAHAVGTPAGL